MYKPPAHPPPEKHPRAEGFGTLSILPDHIISDNILIFASANDLLQLALASRIMYVFARDDQIWRQVVLRKYGKDNEKTADRDYIGLVYDGSWRITFALQTAIRKQYPLQVFHASIDLQGTFSSYLHAKWLRCHMDVRTIEFHESLQYIKRIPLSMMTGERFRVCFEVHETPCMLVNDKVLGWPAFSEWTIPKLVEKYGDVVFKVGNEYGYPRNVKMSFRAYIHYMYSNRDESPLYIFDSKFEKKAPELLQQYTVPHIFEEDYLTVLGDKRPAFRWLVIGPARSGASWHVDPLHTSAWNTLISGQKRWALYPPDMEPPAIDDNMSSLQWYLEVYPNLPPEARPLEIVQFPGDTIFVPGGWWHMVLNIDAVNIAVTQNWMGTANAKAVLTAIAHENEKMFEQLDSSLTEKYPHLCKSFEAVKHRVHRESKPEIMDEWVQKAIMAIQKVYPDMSESIETDQNLIFCGHENENMVFYFTSKKIFVKFYQSKTISYSLLAETLALRSLETWYQKNANGGQRWFPKLLDTDESQGYVILESCGDDLIPLIDLMHSSTQSFCPNDSLISSIVDRLKTLHHIPTSSFRPFDEFVAERLDCYYKPDRLSKNLTQSLVSTVQEYVTSWNHSEIAQYQCVGILHGDVIPANIMGVDSDKQDAEGLTSDWNFSHLIDFGDAFLCKGDPLWDLVCFYVSVLLGSRVRIPFRRLCDMYGYEWNRRTTKRAMIYVLVWPYEVLLHNMTKYVFSQSESWSKELTWSTLEDLVFGES